MCACIAVRFCLACVLDPVCGTAALCIVVASAICMCCSAFLFGMRFGVCLFVALHRSASLLHLQYACIARFCCAWLLDRVCCVALLHLCCEFEWCIVAHSKYVLAVFWCGVHLSCVLHLSYVVLCRTFLLCCARELCCGVRGMSAVLCLGSGCVYCVMHTHRDLL